MKIGVIGVGRLGICFALLLDRAGHDVMASDIRTNYVAALNRGEIETNEPGVTDLLSNKKAIQHFGNFFFTTTFLLYMNTY